MKKFAKRMAALLLAVSMLAGLVVHAEDTDVAKIGETGYATFDEALAEAPDNATITLLKDATLASAVTTEAGVKVTVDMAGHTLSYTSAGALVLGDDLTFTGGGKIDISNGWGDTNAIGITTGGTTVRFDGVDVNVSGTGTSSKYWASGSNPDISTIIFDNGAKLTSTYGANNGYFASNLSLKFANKAELDYYPVDASTRFLTKSKLWLDDATASISNVDYVFYRSGFYVRNGSTFTNYGVSNFTYKAHAYSVFYVDNTSTFELKDKGTPSFVATPMVADGATFDVYKRNGTVDDYVWEPYTGVTTTAVAVEALDGDAFAGVYTTIADARATGKGTYKVVDDSVLADVAFDLNGETWIIDEYTAASASMKITDSVGTGVLKCNKLNLTGANDGYMPLYNAEKGGYGMYKYTLNVDNTNNEKVGDARRFWYNVAFEKDEAYDLVIAGTSKLTFGADIADPELDCGLVSEEYATEEAFATAYATAKKGNANIWLYIDVNGLDSLSDYTLNLTPTLEISGQTVEISNGAFEYAVN